MEILEDVTADAEVVEACLTLKEHGYLIALDDVVYGAWSEPLLRLADFVKVDFSLNTAGERADIVAALRPRGVKLLAEKVATWADVAQALQAGYHYFQGFFFSEPEVVSGKDIPASKLSRLLLLREIFRPETDVHHLADIIKREVTFTLKLLTYLNTAAFGFPRRIQSVEHALLLLGDRGVRKWASMVALVDVGHDKPFELVVTSVVRAKFCEELTGRAGLPNRAQDGFFLGLFSLLDALLGRPLADALATLPIDEAVRAALLGADSELASIYRLALAYERGDWPTVTEHSRTLGLDESTLPELYLRSVEWGNATASLDSLPAQAPR